MNQFTWFKSLSALIKGLRIGEYSYLFLIRNAKVWKQNTRIHHRYYYYLPLHGRWTKRQLCCAVKKGIGGARKRSILESIEIKIVLENIKIISTTCLWTEEESRRKGLALVVQGKKHFEDHWSRLPYFENKTLGFSVYSYDLLEDGSCTEEHLTLARRIRELVVHEKKPF